MRWLGLRLGRQPLPRVRLLRAAVRLGRRADPCRQGVRGRPHRRRDPRASRHADRARPQLTVARPAASDESLDLFERMRAGEFPNGARVLRAKIDMASPNINLRDPVLYRIVHATHPRTGDAWCIYPTYDFAHGQSDAIEGVTHSLCTLEFEIHRPLYDWLIDNLSVPSKPRQIEFARLSLTHTVLSKRVLLRLVNEGHVRGWDDPRMPTISGLRRRGFPAEGIRDFATMIGVAKADFDRRVRAAGVRRPQRAQPDRAASFRRRRPAQAGHRQLPRGPGRAGGGRQQPRGSRRRARARCRSRASCGSSARTSRRSRRPSSSASRPVARCACAARTSSPARASRRTPRATSSPCTRPTTRHTRGGDSPDGRRPKATLHWLSAAHALPAEIRLYDHLFTSADPGADGRPVRRHQPRLRDGASRGSSSPSLAEPTVGETVQFERLGYFCADPDSRPAHRSSTGR